MSEPLQLPSSTRTISGGERIIFDLSHPLSSSTVPTCSGHPAFSSTPTLSIAKGDPFNVHTLTLGSHTGTHIDAPYHIFEDGKTVEMLDLSLLVATRAVVIDMRHKNAHDHISWGDLKAYSDLMKAGVAVLVCTGWSRYWRQPTYSHHPSLEADAARRILDSGVRVIGVDTMSPDEITPAGDTGMVHREVLGVGGVIVENLNGLERLFEHGYRNVYVSMLPLRLVGCDGSPVRAVAWIE